MIVICLLTLLACAALIIVRVQSLFAAVMLAGIYSFLGAGWMLLLDAPDVAFTEASVGAGVSTVLMLGTLALTGRREKNDPRTHAPALMLAILTGLFLWFGTLDMPHYGAPDAPIHGAVSDWYLDRSEQEIGIPNVVTSVLASYRGYDTLGETTVIFTAGIAVLLLLRELRDGRGRGKERR